MQTMLDLLQNPEPFLRIITEKIDDSVAAAIEKHMKKEVSQPKNELYISVAEAVQLLKTTKQTIYQDINKGFLKKVKYGRKTLFLRSEVESLPERKTIKKR